MNDFWAAWTFLTRLPAPRRELGADNQAQAPLWYPLVGIAIGLLACTPLLLGLPPVLAAALVLAAWVLITGGLHLDGLADSADAWVGGHGDRERTLEIMRDPRSGPLAVVALVLLLLLKYAALVVLLEAGEWSAVIAAALWGRAAVLLLLPTTPSARPDGLAAAAARQLPTGAALQMVALSVLLLLLAGHWAALLGGWLAYVLVHGWMLRALGGTTGDTAGALLELVELGALLAAVWAAA